MLYEKAKAVFTPGAKRSKAKWCNAKAVDYVTD